MSPNHPAPASRSRKLARQQLKPERIAHPTSPSSDREKMGARANSKDPSPSGEEWNYSSGMKIFHFGEGPLAPLTATGFIPMPPDRPLPGYLCQAARALLNVSQAWLWQRAKVSRKTINDFENGYAAPKVALNLRMKRALEHAGAQFIHGEDMVGVVVYAAKPAADC